MPALAPKLAQGSVDIPCCENNVCAPVPGNAVLYLNAELLPQQAVRGRSVSGRASHCDCIVIGECPGLGPVAVAYELKALGMLYHTVATLLSPRYSGHGVQEHAKDFIKRLNLDTKLGNCIAIATSLASVLGIQPVASAAVLVVGFNSSSELLDDLKRFLEKRYGREPGHDVLRGAVEALKQFLTELAALLAQKLGHGSEVLLRPSNALWAAGVCRELRSRRKRSP